jgi:hypothetical protein
VGAGADGAVAARCGECIACTEEPALVKAYDEEMAGFSRRSGMGDENWSGRVLLRMGKLAALSGRDKMVAVLRGMGFPLK